MRVHIQPNVAPLLRA